MTRFTFAALPRALVALLLVSPALSGPTCPNDPLRHIALQKPKPPEEPVCCLKPLPPLEPVEEQNVFLSFEDWKAKQFALLQQAQVDGAAVGPLAAVTASSKSGEAHAESPTSELGPSAWNTDGSSSWAGTPTAVEVAPPDEQVSPHFRVPLTDRFNYASTDCSARVHTAHRAAKSPSAILSSKRDRYMLSPCERAPEGQFVVVELCDDIRIDTVQLANFEFFSGVFKDFSVKVAKTYMTDPESWTHAGTYRAKNVRGVQSFHPPTTLRDFYRYIRIDFHSHYGAEYYCPVSLLRVYGLTHLEEWKWELWEEESRRARRAPVADAGREAGPAQVVPHGAPLPAHVPVPEGAAREEVEAGGRVASATPPVKERDTEPVLDGAGFADPSSEPASQSATADSHTATSAESTEELSPEHVVLETDSTPFIIETVPLASLEKENSPADVLDEPATKSSSSQSDPPDLTPSVTLQSAGISPPGSDDVKPQTEVSLPVTSEGSVIKEYNLTIDTTVSSPASDSQNATSITSSSAASSAAPATTNTPSPSVGAAAPAVPPPPPAASGGGESIYRTIMNRLTALEANHTLYARYMEEQTASVREVLRRMGEDVGRLEGIGKAQAQLFQRTVNEWERQRRRWEMEHGELVTRVNYLADEIVLEKRIGIAQLCLLLAVLVFMALTRGSRSDAALAHRHTPPAFLNPSAMREWGRRNLSFGSLSGLRGDWVGRLRSRSRTPQPVRAAPVAKTEDFKVEFPSAASSSQPSNSARPSPPPGHPHSPPHDVARPRSPPPRLAPLRMQQDAPRPTPPAAPRPPVARSNSAGLGTPVHVHAGAGGARSARRWARSAHLHEVRGTPGRGEKGKRAAGRQQEREREKEREREEGRENGVRGAAGGLDGYGYGYGPQENSDHELDTPTAKRDLKARWGSADRPPLSPLVLSRRRSQLTEDSAWVDTDADADADASEPDGGASVRSSSPGPL